MIKKINWDTYYIAQTFLIAQKSIDPSTKCGAIWVSENNIPLSEGYNGPLQNIDDDRVPLTRPEKYFWMIHAEENCLLSYNGGIGEIENSKMYITGRPCYRCLRMMLRKGIKKIIYAGIDAICIDEKDMKAQLAMLELKPDVEVIKFDNINDVKDLFNKSIFYIDDRWGKKEEGIIDILLK